MTLESRGRMFLLTSLAMAIGSTLAGAVSVGLEPALAAVLGAALALALGVVGARLMTLQAERLTAVAKAMAVDESQARASDASAGEFQELGQALNQLAERLASTSSALRAERDRFSVVLEGMVEGVIGLTPDGRIALCNRSATRMLGERQPPLERRLLDLVRQPALKELIGRAQASVQATTDGVPEVELAMPSGARLSWSAWSLDRAGIGVLLAIRDVTTLRRLETMRRDFISNVSHELRTPVATVYASAEALVDGGLEDPAVARDFSQTILRHAERMSRIISDLLDLSRIEAGAYDLSPSGVQVTERIRHAVRLLEPTTAARHQTITTRIEDGLSVRGNAQAIDQVLVNLLENASKYTPQGSHVEVGCRRDGARVELWVADDGPGIAPQHRERIFERFYRVDAGRSRELGGTGLGLAIVKHLVEAMGGSIACEANEPQGARFCFWLQA